MIGIIDYGMGNIHSVRKALEFMGGEAEVTSRPERLSAYAKLVLPGVGAFGDAMAVLGESGLAAAIRGYLGSGRPFLGICLGMHLLFEQSEESPGIGGLGVFKGNVRRFPAMPGLKVPQMGWNTVASENDCPLLKDIGPGSVYFCHSYYPDAQKTDVAGVTEYGIRFPSVIWKKNVFGCQFHPEKSQGVGLAIMKNFVNL